eukprot:scaffold876_cov243-Pinguiococcus_pyrenoidosus.AAC.5
MLLLLALLSPASAEADAGDLCGGFSIWIHDLPKPSRFFQAYQESSSRVEWDVASPLDSDLHAPEFQEPPQHEVPPKVPAIAGLPCDEIVEKTWYQYTFCAAVSHLGMGPALEVPAWESLEGLPFYDTYSFSLDWLLLRYARNLCHADREEEADLFLVSLPLPLIQKAAAEHRFDTDELTSYMAGVKHFLHSSAAWRRHEGRDHVLIVSKTTNDYKDGHQVASRQTQFHNGDPFWAKTTFLSIEGPYHARLVNVPYPTFFHPRSDADVERWLDFVANTPRNGRVVLSVGERRQRRPLINACKSAEDVCDYEPLLRPLGAPVDDGDAATEDPEARLARLKEQAATYTEQYASTISMYTKYTFAMQPGGDTPTRRGFFDTLICGGIPVIFGPLHSRVAGGFVERYYHPSYARFFGYDVQNATEWLEQIAIVAPGEQAALTMVREISEEAVERMRRNILELIPSLLFWDTRWRGESSKYGKRNVLARALRELRDHPYTGEPSGDQEDNL